MKISISAALVVILIGSANQLSGRLSQLRVDRNVYPVDAFQFMADNRLEGRMVVTFDWAQYAIAAFCADQPADSIASTVAFDGRFRTCYPQQILDMHFDFLYGDRPGVKRYRHPESPPIDPGRVLRYGSPEIVVNRRRDENSELHMKQFVHEWVLLYQDGLAQVWGSRQRFGNPSSPSFLPPEKRRISHLQPMGSVTWPALPIRKQTESLRYQSG
jgi:hypothetical protein